MKLQDLPTLLPGADVRVRMRNGLAFVTVWHDGKRGAGIHRELTFATRHAVCDLKSDVCRIPVEEALTP